MLLHNSLDIISEEQYLHGEKESAVKHEYIDGYIYAMAGASKNHERIIMNMAREFGNHLKKTPCEPFASDVKVKVKTNFFTPMSWSFVTTTIATLISPNPLSLLSMFHPNRRVKPMKPLKEKPIRTISVPIERRGT